MRQGFGSSRAFSRCIGRCGHFGGGDADRTTLALDFDHGVLRFAALTHLLTLGIRPNEDRVIEFAISNLSLPAHT